MKYKIVNGTLLLPGLADGDSFRTEVKDLYINNGVIEAIGNNDNSASCDKPSEASREVIDAKGHLIMPALINMHTHAYMTVLRNYADDVDFEEWLFKRCMPVEDKLPREAAYWTSLLGIMEMLRSGTGCFVDMHMFEGQSARAAKDAGIRAFIGRGLVGEDLYGDGLSRFKEAISEKEEYECELIKFILSPHAIYSCSPKLISQVVEESEKRGMLRQTHLSESDNEVDNALKQYGKTPVALFKELGFLSAHTILAHCVKMRDNDIDILAESGSTVVTNPASNAKLGNGFAPIGEMREAGINIALGTDGTASNNTLNMFREMGLLSLIQKGIHQSSVAAPASFVVSAATKNAAKALNMEDNLGVIKKGAYADLQFLDLSELSLFPDNNLLSALCYSANGSEVDSVMVNGKFVMRKREYPGIDKERVLFEVNKIKEQYL